MGDSYVYVAFSPLMRSMATGKTPDVKDLINSAPALFGPDQAEFTAEFTALVGRIHELEAKAAHNDRHSLENLPDTNGSSPFTASGRSSPRFASPLTISPNLPAQRGANGLAVDPHSPEHFQAVQDHVKAQQEIIQRNKLEITSLQEELKKSNQKILEKKDPTQIETLRRELKKSQQANEAFSKSLREIGEIVTAGECCSDPSLSYTDKFCSCEGRPQQEGRSASP